jgi:hypothetical protein
MMPSLRIVTRMPLDDLWDENGDIEASRQIVTVPESAFRLEDFPGEYL